LHRLEACRRLGWKKIPARVEEVSDEEALLLNVVENLQRNSHINPVAEAQGYKRLIERGWTMVQIAEKIGKSCSYVSDRLRTLNRLHPRVRERLSFPRGKTRLTISRAEHLSLIEDPQQQLRLAELIDEEGMSVRQLDHMTRRFRRLEKTLPEGCLCEECPNYPCRRIVR
jgi:ParB family chromosome partitioning protein